MTNQRGSRRVALASIAVLALLGLGACGDDDDEAAAEDAGEAAAGDGGGTDEFCEGFLGVERAFAEIPDDPAGIPAFIDERVRPNLALVEGNEPAPIADDVRVMVDAIDEVAESGDFAAFEAPAFSEASAAVYTGLDDACGIDVVTFTAVDYGYEGLPDTLPPGPTSFVMTNESELGEAHEFGLVKLRDDVELSLEEILALPEAEADAYVERFAAGVFAPAGSTAGSVVDLEPGRWAYVCFLPVGSVDGTDGSGPPHFVEGMAGEFTVA